MTRLFAFLFLCLVLYLVYPPSDGVIALLGGGTPPTEVLSWIKSHNPLGTYLLITCDIECSQKWHALLGNNIKFILPEELKYDDLRGIGCIVIEGGDQWDYLQRLDGRLLEKAHHQGIMLVGTSAGSMILGQHYFTAEHDTITSEEAMRGEGVCLGRNFVSLSPLYDTIIDTHFEERQRHGRLQVFLRESGASRGIGIDERTALCIDNYGMYIIGKGNVKFLYK